MNEIIKKLEKANEYYKKTGDNLIPESQYFEYEQLLQKEDPDHPYFQKVHVFEKGMGTKVKHSSPMLSLEKAYTIEEVMKWAKKVSRSDKEIFSISPKFDGIAGRREGDLLLTRGDGEEGENISEKSFYVRDYENYTGDGELILSYDTFEKLNEGAYKAARNAITGIFSSKTRINRFKDAIIFAKYTDFELNCSFDNIESTINQTKFNAKKFPTDGVVIKLKDTKYAKSLGYTSHHWKHSIALKHANESKTSKLIDVEFQGSKDYIGIVGLIEPIDFNGIIVKRVSLHNMDIIRDMDLMIGDTVEIERAGDVIPLLISRIKGKTREEIKLTECPECGSKVTLRKQFYECSDEFCPAKDIGKIEKALDIFKVKGIGSANVRFLVENKLAMDITELYSLNESQISQIPNFKEKSIKNFQKALNDSKKRIVYDYQIFGALGIKGFGTSLFKKIFKEMNSFEFMEMVLNSSDLLENIDGLGEERIKILIETIPKKRGLIKRLLNIFNETFTESLTELNEPLNSNKKEMKTICFSGTAGKLNMSKKNLQVEADKLNLEVFKSPKKGLDYFVIADTSIVNPKIEKAIKYGAKIMTLEQFQEGI